MDAKEIFQRQCSLDLKQLKQVWDLVDIRREGKLTRGQFIAAMFILYNISNRGIPAPNELPSQLQPFVNEEAPSTGMESQFGMIASPPKQESSQFDFGVTMELNRPAQQIGIREAPRRPSLE